MFYRIPRFFAFCFAAMVHHDIPTTMKAVVVREVGGPEQLKVETDFPSPQLSPGSCIVKNEYAGINFIDTYFRSGLYKKELPFIAGNEGGGHVVAVSKEASNAGLSVGDRVVYTGFVSYCEYTSVPASRLVSVPSDVDMSLAIACMLQGLTAHYLVSSAHADLIKKGEWCLIYSVGSGTAQWAAQMAKIRGYRVIGTCSEGKEESARAAGCDELIVLKTSHGKSHADYASVDIAAKVMDFTGGKGAKCIIDGVGLSTFDISLSCLATRGVFISFGNASGAAPDFSPSRLAAKSGFISRPSLSDYIATRDELMARSSEIFGYLESGNLKVQIDKVIPLDDAVEGHVYIQSGKTKGKVLYKV